MTSTTGNSAIMNQYLKIFKHTRMGSYATRVRYKNSCKLFIEFLDERFKLKNLRNLSNKHVIAYIEYRQENGISAKTIKNDLAAIRFMHDFVDQARYELASNEELAEEYVVYLDNTPAVKGNRAWTEEEIENFYKLTQYLAERTDGIKRKTAKDMGDIVRLCKLMGFRISEVTCMKRNQLVEALKNRKYTVRGEAKNGRHREIPVPQEAKAILQARLSQVKPGGLVFVAEDEKVHKVVQRYEKFLQKYRDTVTTKSGKELRTYKGEVNELTFHGLRYFYVQSRMKEEMSKGFNYEQAAMIVSEEVGHSRSDVIDIYVSNTKEDLIKAQTSSGLFDDLFKDLE